MCRLNDAFGSEFEGDRSEVLGEAVADAIEAYHFATASLTTTPVDGS